MRIFTEAIESEPQLRNIITQCRDQTKICHGVTLRLHPWLELLWLLGSSESPDDPLEEIVSGSWAIDVLEHYRRRLHPKRPDWGLDSPFFKWEFWRRYGGPLSPLLTDAVARPITAHELQKLWHKFGRHFGPMLLVLVDKRLNQEQGGMDLPQGGGERYSFQVVQRQRPLALTCAVTAKLRPLRGGSSIGHSSDDPLTLGGMLEDASNGAIYGVTCWHGIRGMLSADQPAQADGGRPSDCIGQVAYYQEPHVIPSGSARTLSAIKKLRTSKSGVTTTPANMDIALVELSVATGNGILGMPMLKGVMPRDGLAQMQAVSFAGRTSGVVQRSCGGYAAHRLLKDNRSSDEFCYDDLFEIRTPYGSTSPVQGGDSGAWVQAQDAQGQDMWAGMVVGGDSQIGFAMPAEAIKNWWTKSGLNLVIR